MAVLLAILLIWLYTFRGGIKTIVFTDTLQTAFMLLGAVITIWYIKEDLNWGWGELVQNIRDDERSTIFNWDWQSGNHFFKQFFSGAFIAIVMTGLDQDMMQKNLTCRNLKDAQKNMFWYSGSLLAVNILFLSMGVLLYLYSEHYGILLPERTDNVFPMLATEHFSWLGGVVFLLGITAAAYSSADSALTALTTSFCVDFLGFRQENYEKNRPLRMGVHFLFSMILFLVVLIFHAINDQSVITSIFVAAGYTYGPLLGLFAFGILTRRRLRDGWVPLLCLIPPLLCYVINRNSEAWLGGYRFGFEILILNGFLTFLGLWAISRQGSSTVGSQ
jgi:Na+/proline symporter